MDTIHKPSIRRIAFVGNYLPRQCGIATFTTDLCEGIAAQYPEIDCLAVAMNDQLTGYEYPDHVRFAIPQDDLSAYKSAANYLNMHDIELVCLQHEFGIFGGSNGRYILSFLHELQAPVVTTLHTILTNPDPNQFSHMKELTQLSDRLVVMSQRGCDYLQDIYGVSTEKIDVIPHGIPDVPRIDPALYKEKLGVSGKQILLTFGLLSPNKGIEYVIQALPAIVEQHPDLIYLVLGATHPNVKREQGETYRQTLQCLAKELGVDKNVVFYDRFADLTELVDFIGAADIYITPYLNPSQIVSGTLAYTVGAGKAVLSTPYWYAEELLDEGRGRLFPFRDSQAIAQNVLYLLNNETELHSLQKRAYAYGRKMIWKEIAVQYMNSFERTLEERLSKAPTEIPSIFTKQSLLEEAGVNRLPAINLDHLLRMTDHTGIYQHAIFSIPNYTEGYTTDDNARALILALMLNKIGGYYSTDIETLAGTYLAFIWHAFNQERGWFRNFLSFERKWLEDVGSEDSHGRALWSLGSVVHYTNSSSLQSAAARLFSLALPTTREMTYPRAWAFTLLGIYEYLCQYPGDQLAISTGESLSERLMDLYHRTRGKGWYWFEDTVTYNNATLPHALLLSSQWLKRADLAQTALESLSWLAEIQTSPQGFFIPIGNNGFYPRGGEKARFDQQPIEASAMVAACLEAYRTTGEQFWGREAQRAFEWFLGQNALGIPMYDPDTGGCNDGLHPSRVNRNQGAESTLAFLMALSEMHLSQPLLLEQGVSTNFSLLLELRHSHEKGSDEWGQR